MNEDHLDPDRYLPEPVIMECPDCEVELEIIKETPVLGQEEIYPDGINLYEYDGPWPPPGTKYYTVQYGSDIEAKCPKCGKIVKGRI